MASTTHHHFALHCGAATARSLSFCQKAAARVGEIDTCPGLSTSRTPSGLPPLSKGAAGPPVLFPSFTCTAGDTLKDLWVLETHTVDDIDLLKSPLYRISVLGVTGHVGSPKLSKETDKRERISGAASRAAVGEVAAGANGSSTNTLSDLGEKSWTPDGATVWAKKTLEEVTFGVRKQTCNTAQAQQHWGSRSQHTLMSGLNTNRRLVIFPVTLCPGPSIPCGLTETPFPCLHAHLLLPPLGLSPYLASHVPLLQLGDVGVGFVQQGQVGCLERQLVVESLQQLPGQVIVPKTEEQEESP